MIRCPIIPDQKLAFVAIPKNAGTSIRAAFGQAQGFVESGEFVKGLCNKPWPAVHTKRDIQALEAQGYLRFCVARNPWARLVSCWKNKRRNLEWIRANADHFVHDMEFLPFVRAACAIPDQQSDRHLKSQHQYIFDGETLLVDHILRFEHLQQD